MSSAETLNFGPQWLRELSEGSGNSSTSNGLAQSSQALAKFKLADYRYGREEMLALFLEESEVPEELNRAPSLVSEIIQIPLALRASGEHSQSQLPSSFRSRGGISAGMRGRSIPSRGRGRGRGSAWAEHDDGPIRRPPLRRAESEDWRGDSLRGKGDGAEDIMNGLKEWRVSGKRGGTDFWKDAWRDKPEDGAEHKFTRSRSLSSKDADDGDRQWNEGRMNGFNAKSNDVSESPNDEDRTGYVDVKGDSKEKDPAEPECVPDQTAIDRGGADQSKRPLEPVQEHEAETSGPKQVPSHAPPETKSRTEDKSHLEDIFKKLSTNDAQQNLNRQVFTTTNQYPSPTTEPVGTKPNSFHQSSFATEPTSSASPMAQLQALATTWYYKDPQGDIQGPFSSVQMHEWFNAGYFAMELLVKRACDQEFTPLGDLIKRLGQVPFSPSVSKISFPPGNGNAAAAVTSTTHEPFSAIGHQARAVNVHAASNPVSRMPSMEDLQMILERLSKNPDFCRLETQQQQLVVLQYAEQLKRQTFPTEAKSNAGFTDSNSIMSSSNSATMFQADALALARQKMLEEARRKEEEEIRKIQMQKEEQKELLRQQEEELRRKKEILILEERKLEQLKIAAQQEKEMIERQLEEDRKRQRLKEMEESERRRIEEERLQQQREMELRQAEENRLREEETKRRMEEERRRMEEEAAREERMRLEELRRMEFRREEQRMLEERRRQEQRDRELQRERQIPQAQLPQHARWAQGQVSGGKQESLSLLEIQKLEAEAEKARLEEEARMTRENRRRAPKAKSGWGSNRETTGGLSLIDIQREEAKQMSSAVHTVPAVKLEPTKSSGFGSLWSKPPKIQPDPPKSTKPQSSFWDQVVEDNHTSKKTAGTRQPQPSQAKQGKASKSKASDEQQVKALFRQQSSKDRFTEWCESYLRKMNVGSIDVPTFVNFLRDVESPYEVQEYVQSYLGESKEARGFTSLFLEERAKLCRPENVKSKAKEKSRSSGARDTDGFEVVTSNAKEEEEIEESAEDRPEYIRVFCQRCVGQSEHGRDPDRRRLTTRVATTPNFASKHIREAPHPDTAAQRAKVRSIPQPIYVARMQRLCF